MPPNSARFRRVCTFARPPSFVDIGLLRLRIWESIWPEDTPRDDQIDVEFLAERFEITGGNIRNIAVAAAFLAADDGQMVRMGHLMLATQREYQKMGKLTAEKEFKCDSVPGRETGNVSPTAIP